MSTLLFSATAGALALVTGMAALAQDLPEPRDPQAPAYAGGRMGGGGRPITRDAVPAMVAAGCARLDANGDGVVTRAEYDAFREAQRAARMARRGGGDGASPPPGGMGGGMRGLGPLMSGPHWFETADAKGDGRVTLAEAQAAALATFDRLDTNHDGTLTPDERRAGMAAMRGPGGGPQ